MQSIGSLRAVGESGGPNSDTIWELLYHTGQEAKRRGNPTALATTINRSSSVHLTRVLYYYRSVDDS